MRIEPLDDGEHLLLTTYKRDGSPVPTPVWFAGSNGRFVCISDADAGKCKRLRGNNRAEVASCSSKGDIYAGAAILAATARVLEEQDDLERAEKALKKKYGMKWRSYHAGQSAYRKARKIDAPQRAVVEITLTEAI